MKAASSREGRAVFRKVASGDRKDEKEENREKKAGRGRAGSVPVTSGTRGGKTDRVTATDGQPRVREKWRGLFMRGWGRDTFHLRTIALKLPNYPSNSTCRRESNILHTKSLLCAEARKDGTPSAHGKFPLKPVSNLLEGWRDKVLLLYNDYIHMLATGINM